MKELESLFETKEQRRRAIEALSALRQHEGWHLLGQMYALLIKDREERILEDETMTETERKDLKIQRKDFMFSRDLPEDIIKDLVEVESQDQETDEIY